jgi:signal peptidase I
MNMATAGETAGIDLAVTTLATFGRLRLKVSGTSMLPDLLPGDVVALEACAPGELVVGEMALFRREGRLVLHRVIGFTDGGLLTQGDALTCADPPVAAVDVLGKVVKVTRRDWQSKARRRTGWRLQAGRLLFGHGTLAARIFMRWQRFSAGMAA